jgi:Flp pilus assembly protein TadB
MSSSESSVRSRRPRRRGRAEAAQSASETVQIDLTEVEEAPPSAPTVATVVPTAARRRRRSRLTGSGAGVWVGLFVTAAGFGLLALTWGKTASLVDVAAQVPYLVSGAFTGLGLILVGVLVVNLTVKRRDARDRDRQQEELREAIERLRAAVEGRSEES